MCNRLYATQDALQRHKQQHDTNSNDSNNNQLYDQFIADNFDMSCDLCTAVFTTIYDARLHYKECHNDDKGYVKCCHRKLRSRMHIRDHIENHLNFESLQ